MSNISEMEIRAIVDKVLARTLEKSTSSCARPQIPVEVSARHVHLTREAAEALFGVGHKLTVKRELSQPGEFLAQERVKLVTASGEIANVAVLGPERSKVQVEISATDARTLGIKAPVRLSGDLTDAANMLLVGPAGMWQAPQCTIIAKAHIHMKPEDASMLGVNDRQRVSVRLDGQRPVRLEDVVVRVSKNFALAMHIDFDEANAGLVDKNTKGTIIVSDCAATISENVPPPSPSEKKSLYIKQKLITEADAQQIITSTDTVTLSAVTILTPAAKDVFTQAKCKVIRDRRQAGGRE